VETEPELRQQDLVPVPRTPWTTPSKRSTNTYPGFPLLHASTIQSRTTSAFRGTTSVASSHARAAISILAGPPGVGGSCADLSDLMSVEPVRRGSEPAGDVLVSFAISAITRWG